jgi:hypothetical protein
VDLIGPSDRNHLEWYGLVVVSERGGRRITCDWGFHFLRVLIWKCRCRGYPCLVFSFLDPGM